MGTAAKAYRELRSKMRGLHEPRASITQLPLWNTAVFQRETGAIRKGVLKMADLMKSGVSDEAKLTPIAATWRLLYRDKVCRFMTCPHSPQGGPQRVGPSLPEVEHWKLSKLETAMAEVRAPDEQQPEAMWKVIREARPPRKVHSVVRSILWKKLPLAGRRHRMQMADTDTCPLCQRKQDHEHHTKKCPYLDRPIQVLRDLHRPVKTATGGRVEPFRLCLDHPELSFRWEQGIFMCSLVEVPV